MASLQRTRHGSDGLVSGLVESELRFDLNLCFKDPNLVLSQAGFVTV